MALTDAERRAMNDFAFSATYKGYAADQAALLSLESKGLLRRIERAADQTPAFFLTAKGKKLNLKEQNR